MVRHGVGGIVVLCLLLAGCGNNPSIEQLAGKMAAADQARSPDKYVRMFTDLMAHCTNSATAVEHAIDTDASFLTINGYPGGATDWKFMKALHRVVGAVTTDCLVQTAALVQATGATVP